MSDLLSRAGPTSRTRFILVRHGETAWNTEGRLQGHLDIPLNERGREQVGSGSHHGCLILGSPDDGVRCG